MLNVIVLEDDAVSAALVARVFTMHGGMARTTSRVAEAWRFLCEEPADLIILDTDLGGEWGWDMLERVRQSVVFREVPVIVYSATWRREIVRRYMLLGVQGLLIKPYTPARLLDEARRAAESGWREPFFTFAAVPEAGEQRAELDRLLADADRSIDLAERLASHCVDIAFQERMTALRLRARAAGFALLEEVAETMAKAAIEVKAERLLPLVDDMRVAFRVLARVMSGAAAKSPALAATR